MSSKPSHRRLLSPRRWATLGCGVLTLLNAGIVLGQEASDAENDDRFYVYVGYQNIHVDGFSSSIGTLPIGTVDIHNIDFEIEYELNDRWTLFGGIPWIRKRYRGPGPHDPLLIVPPRTDSEFIDNGSYHSSFQDLHVGARYLAKSGPTFAIAPFVEFGIPSNDYTFFAHSAVGQQLDRFEVGTDVSYRTPFRDFYFNWRVGYVFVEETLGVNIDHVRFDTEIGYFLNPNLSVKLMALVKEGNGLVFPDDFPPPRNDEWWFQHDRMVRHNYANAGLGVDWQYNNRSRLSFSMMTMVHAEQVHEVDRIVTMGLARSF